MHIAHFVSNFPCKNTGILYGKTIAASNLCINLAGRHHNVHVFLPSNDKFNHIDDYRGVSVHRYRSLFGYRSERISPGLYYKPRKFDLDIVHVHSGISFSLFCGMNCAQTKKLPLVLTWHGDSIKEYGRYRGTIAGFGAYAYKTYMAKKILSEVDVIISLSSYNTRKSCFLGDFIDKIVEIPNGVNLDEFNINLSKEQCKLKLGLGDKKVVLFAGGLYPLKGPDVLLKAISKVVKIYKNKILFIFLGSGDVKKYGNISKDLGIEENTRFVGYIYEDKVLYYNASDIFVLPSFTEGFPLVILEAMASGVPIIASNVGAIPDAITNNENGLIIPPGDSEALADGIIYLIENEDARKKMGIKSKKKSKNYSWKKISEQTEKVYKNLIR